MGVNVTGDIYKGLTFNGFNSKDFGVYITGEAVYNAPERDVEMIDIPGRNGSFARDNGRFNNIIVEYSAGMFGDAQTDFAEGIAAFRNALCSRIGYQQLTDDYNPDEYRLAVYKSGLEVSPELMGRAGKFNITFECKPQRFTVAGSLPQNVTNGGTLTNPSPFPSNPSLRVWGYGNIGFNGYNISLANEALGVVKLTDRGGANPSYTTPAYLSNLVNNGDVLTVLQGSDIYLNLTFASNITSIDIDRVSGGTFAVMTKSVNTKKATLRFSLKEMNFTAGTSATKTDAFSLEFYFRVNGGAEQSEFLTLTPTVAYNASARTFTISLANTAWPSCVLAKSKMSFLEEVDADSTTSALGTPTYINCEIGEAYKLDGGNPVSLNRLVSMGGKLPELKSGNNTITFDNTITQLKVVPRWWFV